MPSDAAGRYGDKKFVAMMMAKVMCVHMVSALKYNVLFQDVDIVWYKNPIALFEEKESPLQEFDMLFQDDGGHTTRYAPYSANSGFYYVRYNARTEYFFNSLLLAGDLIMKTDSHQQALIALLVEHVSLFGLRVKVFPRHEDDFPGGYQYHMKSGRYMKALFAGKVHPYIFHMSWTENKDNKLLFLQQMGEWHVNEQCVHKQVKEIPGLDPNVSNDYESKCCAAKPIFKCHYRDKASKFPCKDSPPIDAGKRSFW
jgi:Nucleotide-diphospho-sugar transferase